MNLSKPLLFGLFAFSLLPVFGEPIPVGLEGNDIIFAQTTNFTRFSLDFPGGKPAQLIAAIQKATHSSLNVVILDVDADKQLPSLKLNNITLPELFQALQAVSQEQVYVEMLNKQGFTSSVQVHTSYEFTTRDRSPGSNSVWYFHVDKPNLAPRSPEKVCRFYQLTHYLDSGYTVDDITTAAQTAWKMQGYESLQMSYHKETSLLIVVGDPARVKVLDDVLQQIYPWPKVPAAGKPAVAPRLPDNHRSE